MIFQNTQSISAIPAVHAGMTMRDFCAASQAA